MVGSTGGRAGAAWALDYAPLLGSEVDGTGGGRAHSSRTVMFSCCISSSKRLNCGAWALMMAPS